MILQPAGRDMASDICAKPCAECACAMSTFLEMMVLEARYRYGLVTCGE